MSFNFTLKQKQTTLWLAVWLLLLAFLMLLGPVLTPFITAAILAYALHPGVDYLASIKIGKFHLPRVMAVIITMLILLAALMALMLIVLPVLQKELPLLQDQIPSFLNKINTIISPKLQEFGITANLDGSGIKQILSRQLSTGSEEIWSAILSSAKVGSITVLGWLATLVLIPVVLFYLLLFNRTILCVHKFSGLVL
jgi:predicted PurR-regulated permease PerM